MVAVPAFCGTCGLIFSSLRFGGNFRDAELHGRRLPCPRCGAMAETSGGAFDVVERTVESLGAAELSAERLGQLLAALKRFRVDTATSSAGPKGSAGSEATSLLPSLEALAPERQRVVAFFLETVVQMLLGRQNPDAGHRPPTPDDVREAAEHALEHQRMFPR